MSVSIKRISVGLMLMIGIGVIFSSMQAQPQRMSVEERVKILKDSLSLNETQAAKVTKILEDQREEMTNMMNENRNEREAMRTTMQEMMKKTNTQIKAVLTEQQSKKYEEMLKVRQAKMEKRGKRRG